MGMYSCPCLPRLSVLRSTPPMPLRRRIALALLMSIRACPFFPGLPGGPPPRSADAYLFGSHEIWSASEIMRLAGDRPDDPHLGANVPTRVFDLHDEPVPINET